MEYTITALPYLHAWYEVLKYQQDSTGMEQWNGMIIKFLLENHLVYILKLWT